MCRDIQISSDRFLSPSWDSECRLDDANANGSRRIINTVRIFHFPREVFVVTIPRAIKFKRDELT